FGHMAFKPFKSAVLANPGGGIVQLLFNSPTFGPILKGVLAEYGLEENSTKFEQYTLLSQTLIDDADPINYAKKIAPQPTLVFEVKGDEVIPNSVPNYPLSGTEPLLKFMEAKNILDLTQEEGLIELKSPIVYSKFQYGTHSTFLLPDYPEVTNEMHIQTGSFISNEGKKVFVKEIYLLDHGQ
ncbi:MAG: hypothetical protein GXO61_05795, partial [Epsilonproteobacteria bacterium]|nr:hypothetical protein [Campylobacterota bacterium]